MSLQIFGTRKCPATRKAERYFRDRGIPYQFVDLAETGIRPGELRSIAGTRGAAALIDDTSKAYRDRGLAYLEYDPEEEILADPTLLRTPIVRDGRRSAVGDDPAAWRDLAAGGNGRG